jgi:type I restriction enzyme S subunit
MLDGWHTKTLEELARVERGRFSARPRNDPRYYGGTTPFIQTGDISSSQKWIHQWSQTLNAEGVAVSKVFPAGTIFVTIAANIGDAAISTFETACPDSVVAVRNIPEVDREWLFQSLKSKKRILDSYATQNAQKNINLEILKPLPFEYLRPQNNAASRRFCGAGTRPSRRPSVSSRRRSVGLPPLPINFYLASGGWAAD